MDSFHEHFLFFSVFDFFFVLRFQQHKVGWAEIPEEIETSQSNDFIEEKNNDLSLLRSSELFIHSNRQNNSQQLSRIGRNLEISRKIDANVVNPSDQPLNCKSFSLLLRSLLHFLLHILGLLGVKFHSNGSLLLVGGEDKVLRFFEIDGEKNECQLCKY